MVESDDKGGLAEKLKNVKTATGVVVKEGWRPFMVGSLLAGSVAAGFMRAHWEQNGVAMPDYVDPAIQYGGPVATGLLSMIPCYTHEMEKDVFNIPAPIASIGGGMAVGTASIVCQWLGYGAGLLYDKLF